MLPETGQLNIIEHQIEAIIHIANLLQNSLIESLLRPNCDKLQSLGDELQKLNNSGIFLMLNAYSSCYNAVYLN
jgi:hypothetical protein